ncbi:aminoacyl-tRNA hydrolase [Nocardia higoensis]|uniref:aminoacyl-tRNA hydrolase n=1 Tax=Nocardia higoensis TaxID=228599 RepID=UPI001E2F7CBA|nr:aminoacyl-tRNA hydrolase [Nocardia higoensis]
MSEAPVGRESVSGPGAVSATAAGSATASDSGSGSDSGSRSVVVESLTALSDFAARHAVLAEGYGGAVDPEDPERVQAMQMVLHLPKADPPPRSALLAAAASAVVALCLDERVGAGGPWEQRYLEWKRARIRKVARRARGAQWTAAGEVEGVTVEIGGAQARAFVPCPVGETDQRIRRLQIGGTDLEHDEPGPPDPDLPVLWVNSSLGMSLGKAAAQVGHASMLLAGAMDVERAREWAGRGFGCSVREADPDRWRELSARLVGSSRPGPARSRPGAGTAIAVRDAGFTEIAPGSLTVIGVPADTW